MPSIGQKTVEPTVCESTTTELIVEAQSDLACIAQWVKEGVVQVHREQKTAQRCRWTISVNNNIKQSVVAHLRDKRVAVFDCGANRDTFAVLYLPFDFYFAIVHEIARQVHVNIVREAPKWMIVQGKREDVDVALSSIRTVLCNYGQHVELHGRLVQVKIQAGDECDVDCTLLKISEACVQINLVEFQSHVPPWVDESMVKSFMCALQINPAQCTLRKTGDGALVAARMNQADAPKIDKVKYVMPWNQRQVRFFFEQTTSITKLDGKRRPPSGPQAADDVSLESHLSPMVAGHRFVKLDETEKRAHLEHALLERLQFEETEAIQQKAAEIVGKYKGQENLLYYMISEAGVRSVSEPRDTTDTKSNELTTKNSMNFGENDLIEVGETCRLSTSGNLEGCLFVRASQVEKVGSSLHVCGPLITTKGKERKLCDMLLAPAKIERVQSNGRDNLVLKHPGAKLAYGRPSGTAWFTCRPGYDHAMKRATILKAHWEQNFQALASKHGGATLCLNQSGQCFTCSEHSNTVKVRTWSIIREGSVIEKLLSLRAEQNVGRKIQQVCDKYLKHKCQGATGPPNCQ